MNIMRESQGDYVPIKYAKERPRVFPSETSWNLVKNFALHYKDLRVTPETKGITSSADLIERVRNTVREKVENVLPAFLTEKDGFDETQKAAFLDVAVNRSFKNIDFKSKETVMTALGLAMVAEHARTHAMTEALTNMDETELKVLDMTPTQRNVIVDLLKISQSVNPEYLRFKTRAMTGEAYPERPVDAIREEARIARGLKKIRETLITQRPKQIFKKGESAFVKYLEVLEKGYQPLSKNKKELLTQTYRLKKHGRFEKAFEKFITEHPDFPLIIIPKASKYVSETAGVKLGYDPDFRISWQSPELKQESQEMIDIREKYVKHLKARFPNLVHKEDLKRISQNRPIIADDLGYFGIGIQVHYEAEEAGATSLLFKNVQIENRRSTQETLRKILTDKEFELINNPEFFEIADAGMFFHEWGHKTYDTSKVVKRLGKAEVEINELKSDILSYAALHDVMGKRARKLYGERAKEALNLYVIGYALDVMKVMSPDGEERPYYMSALAILNRLAEANVIVRNEKGAVTLDRAVLKKDLSKSVFQPLAGEILHIYHAAETASPQELHNLKKTATRLGNQIPHPLVQELVNSV